MVVVVSVGGQPALRAVLTAVPRFVEAGDAHRVRLKQLFDNVAVGVVEVAREIGLGQRRQVAHAVDEELRVGDAVFLFQLSEERRCGFPPTILRKSYVKHDFRIDVNGGVEPHFFLPRELDLFPIDRNAIRLGSELLLTRLGVDVKPVMDSLSGSADAEPLQEVADLRQGR